MSLQPPSPHQPRGKGLACLTRLMNAHTLMFPLKMFHFAVTPPPSFALSANPLMTAPRRCTRSRTAPVCQTGVSGGSGRSHGHPESATRRCPRSRERDYRSLVLGLQALMGLQKERKKISESFPRTEILSCLRCSQSLYLRLLSPWSPCPLAAVGPRSRPWGRVLPPEVLVPYRL